MYVKMLNCGGENMAKIPVEAGKEYEIEMKIADHIYVLAMVIMFVYMKTQMILLIFILAVLL